MRRLIVGGFAAVGMGAMVEGQTIASGGVRFVVAEFPPVHHNDSYTLTLTSAADIAHARALIAGGAGVGAPLVVAHIAVGADGVNRNWRASGAPVWHWHIASFLSFADATIEVLDGSPSGVENDPAGWIAGTPQGNIGFWSYTVVGELPAAANPACPADFNGSGGVSVQDIFDFLNAWLAGSPGANFNGEDGLGVQDIFDFVNSWFAGC